MKDTRKKVKEVILKVKTRLKRKGGFGVNEMLGIAAALILAAFIIIPGLQDFATNVMDKLGDWWDDTIVSRIFPAA